VTSSLLRRCAAEVAGTALLVGIGTGVIVANARTGLFPLPLLAVAWALAVLLPILLFVRVSGAHLNPVVSLALAASGRIDRREVPAYVLAQAAGAFLASGMVLIALGNAGALGATVPADGQVVRAFLAEVAFTALLVASVFALADRGAGRFRWRLGLPPLAVGLSTYVIGPWSGSSLNPARTLAPAVVAGVYIDLWVYLVAVPVGALTVAALWKPRSVDRLDRGPGRVDSVT
jgi:aquaporin NIP